MSDDKQTRDNVENTGINDEPVESVQEEEVKPVNAKSKAKAKPKIKITKEPIETIVEETIIEEVRGAEGTPTEGGKAPSNPSEKRNLKKK